MFTAPPGAEGKEGASPATGGGMGSTFTEEGPTFFAAASFKSEFWTASNGARTSPASFLTQATLVSLALSSASIFLRTSSRSSAFFASTSTVGLNELQTSSDAPSTNTKEPAAHRMLPGWISQECSFTLMASYGDSPSLKDAGL
jgi:hypothetical protein